MPIVRDLSGNRPNNAPVTDPHIRDDRTVLQPVSSEQFTAGSSAGKTGTFASTVTAIRIVATQAIAYRLQDGADAAGALATDTPLAAGVVEYIDVNPGQALSAIRTGDTDATVTVTVVR